MLAMMALTVVDVVGRYFFNAPLRFAFEVTEVLLVLAIFAGLPLVTMRNEHIAIDLLDRLFRGAAQTVQRVAVNLIAAAVLGVQAWMVWRHAGKITSVHTDILGLPLAPLARFIAIMVALAALLFVVRAVLAPAAAATDPPRQ